MQITSHPDTPILTLKHTGTMFDELGDEGVTVVRMGMMAEGGRVMSDNCNTV